MSHRFAGLILLISLGLCSWKGRAAETKVSLLFDKAVATAGEPLLVGVRFELREDWHTYWRYGGDAAQPPSIRWKLPEGAVPGEIQWPLPIKEEKSGLYSYAYHDELILLTTIHLDESLTFDRLDISAEVAWLECREACVPRNATVHGKVSIGEKGRTSDEASILATWNKKVPPPAENLRLKGNWTRNIAEDERQLTLELAPGQGIIWKDFYPFENDAFEIGGKTLLKASAEKPLQLDKTMLNWEETWPTKIEGIALIALEKGSEIMAREISLELGKDFAQASNQSSADPTDSRIIETIASNTDTAATDNEDQGGYPRMMLFAFLGGFILNFMPCVLPVISLKILGFVHQSREMPRRIFQLGLLYGMGVLCSFWILAGLVISVQSAGRMANWGMQFQNPQFLVLMTLLVTLVALNFFGVFEVSGGSLTGRAATLASGEGSMGAFFNGVLATVLATPCTAPFLGPALGFAFTQPPSGIILMFSTVAMGLALPYVLLSWNPAWLRILPKPGAWMEHFKVFMGFPMLATSIWLYTVTSLHFGEKGNLGMGVFLVTVALSAWIYGTFVQRGRKRRGLALILSLVCLALAYGWVLEKELDWRHPVGPQTGTTEGTSPGRNGFVWHPWSETAVQKARSEGKVVLVDFTADWCWNCKINKRSSIEIAAVREKLKAINGITFKGDYTFYDPAITEQLKRHHRVGVPLVLIFTPEQTQEPILLPELLTPKIVLNALEQAAGVAGR